MHIIRITLDVILEISKYIRYAKNYIHDIRYARNCVHGIRYARNNIFDLKLMLSSFVVK